MDVNRLLGEPALQLEISPQVLHRLLCHGTLHADELRCLNHHSHHQLRRLLLESLKKPAAPGNV